MDIYAREIEELVSAGNGGVMEQHWFRGTPLFGYCTQSRRLEERCSPSSCGCLTQVHDTVADVYGRPDITDEIRNDPRLMGIHDLYYRFTNASTDAERRALLEPFAEWQRRLDIELGREPLE